MGNAESMENYHSVRIANETELPLVYVLSQVGPLYWGVLQPGERVTRKTGRIWFTVTCYPYTGNNEPTTTQAVLGVLIPTVTALVIAATFGIATMAAIPAAGTAAAALAPLVPLTEGAMAAGVFEAAGMATALSGPVRAMHEAFVDAVGRATNKVQVVGHFANGDWLYVRGGVKAGEPYSAWVPMRIER